MLELLLWLMRQGIMVVFFQEMSIHMLKAFSITSIVTKLDYQSYLRLTDAFSEFYNCPKIVASWLTKDGSKLNPAHSQALRGMSLSVRRLHQIM
jgi:hypothetical protein